VAPVPVRVGWTAVVRAAGSTDSGHRAALRASVIVVVPVLGVIAYPFS
jgi:hypothetical protein